MSKATKVNKVFISHGRNETVKLKLKNFIKERLGIEPVILAEQPDLGLAVVEKLERYGRECDFALVVLTADDQTASGEARARQNVTHELGFFHGILGRDRVLLLKQSGVELFSNISGLIYKEFDGDKIESVFEDIRIALESCSAQKGGQSIPTLAEIKAGDAVEPKGGGPKMTVDWVKGNECQCFWFVKGEPKYAQFQVDSLKLFEEDKSGPRVFHNVFPV